MTSAQSFTEALSNYLSGDEWQQSIDIFVRTNCDAFLDARSEDYDHKHHALWKTFQDIVENILEMALNIVGGSLESLEKVLDEVSSTPSRGPKEDTVKDILSKLMTFDSFDSFAEMMYNANAAACTGADNCNPYHHERPKPGGAVARATSSTAAGNEIRYSGTGTDHRDTLIALGFNEELVDMVLQGSGEDADLEQLVLVLSELQAQNEDEDRKNKARGKYSDRVKQETKSENPSSGARCLQIGAESPNSKAGDSTAIRVFATEAGVDDLNELNARFVTARSILDTFIDGDTSDGVVIMVQWASDMVELYQSIQDAHSSGYSMSDSTESRPAGLIEWYLELEDVRKDSADGPNSFLHDDEICRMAELDRIAEMGTSDEQLLHSTITRHDEVQKDINLLHRRCGALCGPGTDIQRETIEELYLYLKEKVATSTDLAAAADEMHDHVYSMLDSAKGGDIINLLLEMHVLEDEQGILRQKIDSMLGSPSHHAESKTQESAGGVFGNDSKGASIGDESKSSEAKLESGGYALHNDAKTSAPADPFAKERTASDIKRPRDDDIDEDALKAHVSNMKHGHKKSLDCLKESLDGEKGRALSALEERLLRRKRQRDKDLTAAKADGASTEEIAALEAQLRAEEAEIEAEIASTAEQHKITKDGICSGFKKRCIAEIKATQARGQKLNAEETDDAHRDAADALKNRFFRDNKNLQELLEAERAKTRRKIMLNLEKRKRDSTGDAESLKMLEDEAHQELDDMEIDFEQQEMAALAGPQSSILMALSGIFADANNFAGNLKENEYDEDDGEDFFDDDDNVNENTKLWMKGISNLRDTYMNAGFDLQAKMRRAYQGDDSADDFDSSFGAIAQHMTKVITNAYTSQLSDADAMASLMQKNKLKQGADTDRVKASILEEFEKSRENYEQTLEGAKAEAKSKLEKRKAKKGGAADSGERSYQAEAKEGKEWGSENVRIKKTQAALEEVVDAFLEDPIVIGGRAGAQNPSLQSYSNKFDAKKSSRHAQRKAERERKQNENTKSSACGAGANVPDQANKAKEDAEFAKYKEEQALVAEKDKIKDKSQSREKELIDALQLEMQKKKHRLEERLRRKKAEREREANDDFGAESESLEEQQTQRELDNMESAFDKAVTLLKRTDEGRLKGVNVGQLIDVMDRFVKKGSSTPSSPSAQKDTNSTVDDLEAQMEDASLSWDAPTAPSHTVQAIEARKTMETEVHRISETYNEEKQKLDLMMKIQQTRQKQVLQRKLLDRKQGQGISQGMGVGAGQAGGMRAGAGFSSSSPALVTGGLGKQLPPLQAGAVRGLGAAGTMGLQEVLSPARDPQLSTNMAHADRAVRGGMAMSNFSRK